MLAAILLSMPVMAQKQSQVYLDYIAQWKDVAIEQQADYGIPAAITMAQALLESAAGQSELALEANNHFGIKCAGDWFGGVYYMEDDAKDDCFRSYGRAEESFRDHSLFLQRPRYATCFEIAVEDYEGWAYRLKECGYATDMFYAKKLVKLIEDYRLDTLVVDEPVVTRRTQKATAVKEKEKEKEEPAKQDTVVPEQTPKKKPLKAAVVRGSEPIMVIHNAPEPEYVEPLTEREERDSFLLSHPKRKFNGVSYFVAREGDTYANVAFRLNMRERDLREYNDALGREMAKGDRIYMTPKKMTGTEAYVWAYPGLSLWQLSQSAGVQVQAIQKLNGLDPRIRVFRTRQKIYLKKVKEDGNKR